MRSVRFPGVGRAGRPSLFPVILAALLLPGAGHAQDHPEAIPARPGDSEGLEVRFDRRSSGGTSAERFQSSYSRTWSLSERSRLAVVLPWQRIEVEGPGGEVDASGLRDMTLRYSVNVERPGSTRGPSARWDLSVNVPIGLEGLDRDESAAVQGLNASSDAFLDPQFGRGWGGGVQHTWIFKSGRAETQWYLGVQGQSSYVLRDFPGDRLENSGVDSLTAGWRRRWKQGRRLWTSAVSTSVFGDSESEANGVVTEVESDPNFLLQLGVTNELTPKLTSRLRASYQFRDTLDSLQPGVAVNPTSTELGDRLFFDALLQRKTTPRDAWTAGFTGIRTLSSEQNGVDIPGSDRSELLFRVGFSRGSESGRGWAVSSNFGLTGDSRDLAVTARLFRSF